MIITMKVRRAILALLLALGLTLAATGNAEAGGNYTFHQADGSGACVWVEFSNGIGTCLYEGQTTQGNYSASRFWVGAGWYAHYWYWGSYTVHYCASSSWCYNVGQSMTVHIYRK
jgi:hypothetical protein